MLIFCYKSHLSKKRRDRERLHEKVTESGGGHYSARENIESISLSSLVQLYEDECLEI